MNLVILKGRLTSDPVIRAITNGNVTNFSIAVKRRFLRDGQPDTDFFDCEAFGKLADIIGKHFEKGQPIIVTGSLRQYKYTNKEGRDVRGVSVKVDDFEFDDSPRKPASDATGEAQEEAAVPAEAPKPAAKTRSSPKKAAPAPVEPEEDQPPF